MLSAAIERVQAHHIPAVRCEERRTRAAGCRAGRPVVAAKPRLVQQLVRGSAQGEARRPVWIRSSMRMRGHSAVNAPPYRIVYDSDLELTNALSIEGNLARPSPPPATRALVVAPPMTMGSAADGSRASGIERMDASWWISGLALPRIAP